MRGIKVSKNGSALSVLDFEKRFADICLVFDQKKSKLFPSKFNTKPLRKSFQISNQVNKTPLPESQPLNRNLEKGDIVEYPRSYH